MTDIVYEEVSEKSEYSQLDDASVKTLALAILAGSVFGTWQLSERDMGLVGNIFMPFLFIDDIQRKKMKRDGIAHFYEFMDSAGPRAINGFPTFMSMKLLTAEDFTRVLSKVKQIESI